MGLAPGLRLGRVELQALVYGLGLGVLFRQFRVEGSGFGVQGSGSRV